MKKLKMLLAVLLICVLGSTTVWADNTEKSSEHLVITEAHVTQKYANANAYEAKKITLTPKVTKVQELCFYIFPKLEEIVWNASVNTIPSAAFSCCSNVKKVSISSNVTKIASGAFNTNSSLKEIRLPSNLKSIGVCAFGDCSQLAKVYIPESVTSIGRDAFVRCSKLTVYGKKNSYADYYCRMNDIPFVAQGTAKKDAANRTYVKSASAQVKDGIVYTTIKLDHKVEGAVGYQYQILDRLGKEVSVSKNTRYTSCTFEKAPYISGYARVRSWKKVNGKKKYGPWSNTMEISVKYVKQDFVEIKDISAENGKLTFQVTPLKYSTGYDIKLEWDYHTQDFGDYAVYSYKNNKKSKVTVSSLDLKPGTYIATAHAYIYINGKKNFSSWSDEKKIVIN